MSIFLSVKEVAEYSECDYDTIIKQIQRGTLRATEVETNVRGGTKEGKQYKVELMDLPVSTQNRYWDKVRKELTEEKAIAEIVELGSDDNYTHEERVQIQMWKGILKAWDDYRYANKGKVGQDGKVIRDAVERSNEFVDAWNLQHQELQLSHKTLVRKSADYEKNGDIALIDKRGKLNKGRNTIPDEAWNVFCTYYLDKRELDPAFCYKWTSAWAKKNNIEIPSLKTFARHISDIPKATIERYRGSEEGYNRAFRPYLERSYSELLSNDVWIADNHTLDFMSNADGCVKRLFLTLYIDARSRMPMCWGISENINADIVLDVVKEGWRNKGLCGAIYMDNGREFLTKDITGTLGYRKKKAVEGDKYVPSIFEELEIECIIAKPARGQEKPVEREFLNVKKWFSKLFDSYIGGRPDERPDNAKSSIKYLGTMDSAESVKEFLSNFIEGYIPFQSHKGNGMKGRRPFDVYNENLQTVKRISPDKLDRIARRRTKALMIRENGISFTVGEAKISYFIPEMVLRSRDYVYAMYDHNDMSHVDVYEMNGRLLYKDVPEKLIGNFAGKDEATRAALEQDARYKKSVDKLVKDVKDKLTTKDAPSIRELMEEEIAENLKSAKSTANPIIELFVEKQRDYDDEVLNMAVGAESKNIVEFDIERALNNLKKNKNKYFD